MSEDEIMEELKNLKDKLYQKNSIFIKPECIMKIIEFEYKLCMEEFIMFKTINKS
jgi:hypothetical protein